MNQFIQKHKTTLTRTGLGAFIGGAAGYAYYHYFGCTNGCALQGNPFIMTGYGIMVGVTLLFPSKKKEKQPAVTE